MMMMMADNDDDGHESINENESRGTASTTREAEAASTTTTSPPESPPTPVSPPVTTTTTTTPDNVPKVTSSEGKEEGESSEGEEEAEDGEDSNDDDHGGGQSIKEELGEEDNNIENKVDTTTDQLGLNVNKVMEDVVDMMHDDGEEEEEGEEDEEEDNVSKMDAEEEEEPEPEDEDDDVEEGEILEDGEVEDDSKSGPEMSKTDESDKKSLSTTNIASKESVQSSEGGGGDDQKKSKKSDEKGSSRQRSERRGTSKGKDLDSRDSKRNRSQKQSSGKKRGRGGNDSEDEGHSSDTNNAGLRRQKRPRGGPWSPESGSDGSESGEDGDSQGGDNSFSEDMMMQMFKQMQEMMGKMTKESSGGGGGSANKKKSKMEKIMEKMMKNQQNLDSREMRDMVLRNRRLFSRSGFDRDQRTSGGGGRGPRERDRRRNLTLAERRSLRERDRDRDRLMRDRDRDRLRDRDGKDRRSDSTPKTTTCKFFLEGKCHRGSECPFPHDGQQQKKKDICKFYLQGFCGKGEACLFMHGDFPCKFYHTGVECYSGDNCRFSHQPLTEETRAMLKSYLDSGELPDEVNHDSGNVTSGGNNSGSYQPMKPVAKRHAVLGDVTDDMRSSYWTWLWQQEMKELELAYTGNKRNLFCIEKQFVVNDKPATPPEAMVDGDYDDRENLAGGKVMSFYVDTMPDYDPAMTQSTTADIDDEEKLLEMMSYHDEDLRLPPPNVPTTTTTNSSHLTTVSAAGVDTPLEPPAENDTNSASSIVLPGPFATAIDPPPSLDPRLPVGNEVGSSPQQPPPPPQVSSSVIPEENLPKPALDLLRRIQQRNSQKQGGLGVNEDSESGDNSIAEPLTTSQETIDFQPKEEKKWIIESDEDDDTDDQPLKAALKNLQNQQQQFQQQSQHQPSMQQPSVEASKPKPKIDIAKMLNVIRQTTNQMSGTGAVAAASAAPATQHADFWQNIFSGTNLVPSGGGSSSTGSQEFRDPRFGSVSATGGLSSAVASEPRDPRLKRTKSESKSEMSSSIVSPSSSDTSMSQSSKSTESRRSSISGQSHHQPLVGSDDFKLIAVDAPPIDYSNYVSLYRNDVKMKNDPRLQKFFSKLPNYVMDHLTKPSLQSLSSSSSSSSLLTTSLLNSSSSPSSESSIKAGEVGILITTPSSPTKSTLPPLPPLTLTEPKSTIIPTIVPPPPPLMSPFELTTSRPSLAVPINSIADQIKSELESLDTPEQASYANFGAVNSVRVKQEQPESPPPASAATSVVDTSVNYDVTLRVKQERPEPVSLTHFSYGSGDS